MSFGKASAVPAGCASALPSASEYPSPSVSGQPSRSIVEVPALVMHESLDEAGGGLSPYPSESVSFHCVLSPRNASAPLLTSHTEPLVPLGSGSEYPSPSSSGQPLRSLFEVPGTVRQASAPWAIVQPPRLDSASE